MRINTAGKSESQETSTNEELPIHQGELILINQASRTSSSIRRCTLSI